MLHDAVVTVGVNADGVVAFGGNVGVGPVEHLAGEPLSGSRDGNSVDYVVRFLVRPCAFDDRVSRIRSFDQGHGSEYGAALAGYIAVARLNILKDNIF